MAIVLEKQALYGRVYIWQDDTPSGTAWSKLEIKWRNPEGHLIKVYGDTFKRVPIEQLKSKFDEASRMIESKKWLDEQEKIYIERLELEIADRQRKIQLTKLSKRLGETV